MTMHPRLSLSQTSSPTWKLAEDLAFCERSGIDAIGVDFAKLEAAGDLAGAASSIADAGMRVTNLLAPGPYALGDPERWPDQRDRAAAIMDLALALRPDVVVLSTGPAGTLPWERAADALDEIMRGTVLEADREGLHLAIAHTNPLFVDEGFVHTLRDAIDLGWRLDMGVCMTTDACWSERNLSGTIAAGIDAISIVRVGDFAIGGREVTTSLVPGDGDVPLHRILGQLLDAGYQGVFDLAIAGPRLEEEGYASAIGRGLAHLEEILDDLLGGEDVDNA